MDSMRLQILTLPSCFLMVWLVIKESWYWNGSCPSFCSFQTVQCIHTYGIKIFLHTQSVLWLLGFSVPMKDGTGSSGPGPECFRTWALRAEGKPWLTAFRVWSVSSHSKDRHPRPQKSSSCHKTKPQQLSGSWTVVVSTGPFFPALCLFSRTKSSGLMGWHAQLWVSWEQCIPHPLSQFFCVMTDESSQNLCGLTVPVWTDSWLN